MIEFLKDIIGSLIFSQSYLFSGLLTCIGIVLIPCICYKFTDNIVERGK